MSGLSKPDKNETSPLYSDVDAEKQLILAVSTEPKLLDEIEDGLFWTQDKRFNKVKEAVIDNIQITPQWWRDNEMEDIYMALEGYIEPLPLINRLRDLRKRRFFKNLRDRIEEKTKAERDPDEIAEWAKQQIDGYSARVTSVDPKTYSVGEVLKEGIEDHLSSSPVSVIGLRTGIGEGGALSFDEFAEGVMEDTMIVLGARMGTGKSSLVAELAKGIAKMNPESGAPLMLVSESSEKRTAQQILCSQLGINYKAFLKNQLSDHERNLIRAAIAKNEFANVHIKTMSQFTVRQIESIIAVHHSRHGMPLCIVDMAKDIKVSDPYYSEVERLMSIIGGLMSLKKKFNTCIIATAHLNRGDFLDDTGEAKRPDLHNIRYGDDLANASDFVYLLHRPNFGVNARSDDPRTQLIMAKDRLFGEPYKVWYYSYDRIRRRIVSAPQEEWDEIPEQIRSRL